ncbi:MAG: NHLP bacteriocin export ABC transporter permease/ATPase subunit [Gammaproteobacteria bacterium]|nr:NHLP bacteriocin export ABC transporter permease/ATPase subunit [Gammaproteobacteria bacterium]
MNIDTSLITQLKNSQIVESFNFESNTRILLEKKPGLLLITKGEGTLFYQSKSDDNGSERLFNFLSRESGTLIPGGFNGLYFVPSVNVQGIFIPQSTINDFNNPAFIKLFETVINEYSLSVNKLFPATKNSGELNESAVEGTESEISILLQYQTLKNLHDDSIDKWCSKVLKQEQEIADRTTDDKLLKMGESLGYFLEIDNYDVNAKTGSGENLFQTCSVLGEKLGINFIQPETESDTADDMLKAICRTSHVRMRQVTLKGGWHQLQSGSLLGFWHDTGLPVALLSRGNRGYEVYDPELDQYLQLSSEQLARLSTQAVCFYRPLPERSLTGKDLVQYALRNNSADVWTLFWMSCGIGLIGLLIPMATGLVYDDLIPSSSIEQLWQLGIGLIIVIATIAAFQFTQGIAVNRLEGLVSSPIESALWDRLLNLPSTFFRQYGAGDLANRLSVIRKIHQLLSGTVVSAFLAMGAGLFNFILMFWVSWELALVASLISFIVISLIATGLIMQVKHNRKVVGITSQLQAHTLQIVNAIGRLKINGSEIYAFNSWAKHYAEQRKHTFKARKISNHVISFTSTVQVIALAIFIFVVTYYQQGQFTVGEFLKFSSAFTIFLASTLALVNATMSLGMVNPLYKMIQPVLTAVPEIDKLKKYPGNLSGKVEISNVSFRYSDDSANIIKDYSLEISPGQFIAIVGSSGCGKSTLLRLLLGFEKPQQGTVLYNDQELNSLDIHEVRRQLGVVLQNGKMMSGSIKDNIIGASGATLEQVEEAAQMAGLKEDIEQMPMKYETIISDGTISGGQQQRLLIARAIVNKPAVLYFDEATSALDNETQLQVSRSIEALNATRVVIAHRLSTIKHADKIVVMDMGKIVQQGTYKELIKQHGLFKQLVERQLD